MAMEKTSLPTMPSKGSDQVITGGKTSFTPADKGAARGKESAEISAIKENSSVKQGTPGNAAINNYTEPVNKGGNAVETNPSKGNIDSQNSSGKNPADQYTGRPTKSPVQKMKKSKPNAGGQRSGNVSRSSESNVQQKSNTQIQVPNSNSRVQEHQRRQEYSYPQRKAEQPFQQRQDNRQNRTAPDSRSQNREGYSRYAPSQEYSYPQKRSGQNNSYERKNSDSQQRISDYNSPDPKCEVEP